MGFHRRYINSESLLNLLKGDESLKKIFNADALIFIDNLSEKIYELHIEGLTNKEILNKLNNENN
jgi:hypothetical protein